MGRWGQGGRGTGLDGVGREAGSGGSVWGRAGTRAVAHVLAAAGYCRPPCELSRWHRPAVSAPPPPALCLQVAQVAHQDHAAGRGPEGAGMYACNAREACQVSGSHGTASICTRTGIALTPLVTDASLPFPLFPHPSPASQQLHRPGHGVRADALAGQPGLRARALPALQRWRWRRHRLVQLEGPRHSHVDCGLRSLALALVFGLVFYRGPLPVGPSHVGCGLRALALARGLWATGGAGRWRRRDTTACLEPLSVWRC